MRTITFELNGKPASVATEADTPLLYALREQLGVKGPRFGCGLGQCGACTVLIDGVAVRSCILPSHGVAATRVTTLEGLASSVPGAPPNGARLAVQQAFIDEQAVQCGYCLSGWVMTAVALLQAEPEADDARIRQGLSGIKCRCGAHVSILRAVKRAAVLLREARK